jgi:acyl-CoA synthetase (NDP forming)
VAVGAASNPAKIGGRIFRYTKDNGYAGKLYPINARIQYTDFSLNFIQNSSRAQIRHFPDQAFCSIKKVNLVELVTSTISVTKTKSV